MTARDDRSPRPYWCSGWAWSNWRILLGTERTRKEAVAAAENHTGEPWAKCRKFMEVWKCQVVPRDQ